jgi:hypothetical protein
MDFPYSPSKAIGKIAPFIVLPSKAKIFETKAAIEFCK